MTNITGPRDELRQLGFDAGGLDAGARAMYDALTDAEVGSLCAIVRSLADEPEVEGFRLKHRALVDGDDVAWAELASTEQAVSDNVRALAKLYAAQREEALER